MTKLSQTPVDVSSSRGASIPANIVTLTSLRFIAALYVVIFHFRSHFGIDFGAASVFLGNGSVGVDFFFVLSGFILCHVYGRAAESDKPWYTAFLVKRFARLYPLHIATFLFFVVLYVVMNTTNIDPTSTQRYRESAIPLHLLMLHAWFPDSNPVNTWNGPSWSISAEWFAYIFVFSAMLWVGRVVRNTTALLIASLSFFLIVVFLNDFFTEELLIKRATSFGILRIIPEFALGFALYKFAVEHILERRRALILSAVSSIALIGFLATIDLKSSHIGFLVVPILATVLYALFCVDIQGDVPVLKSGVAEYSGEISYSVYMVHAPIAAVWFNLVKIFPAAVSLVSPLTFSLIGTGLVVVVASASYHLLELPAKNWITDQYRRRNKGGVPSLSAANEIR